MSAKGEGVFEMKIEQIYMTKENRIELIYEPPKDFENINAPIDSPALDYVFHLYSCPTDKFDCKSEEEIVQFTRDFDFMFQNKFTETTFKPDE
jgi:hypothetical protein